MIIAQFEDYDPFADPFNFEELEDEDIFGEEEEENSEEDNLEEDNRFVYEKGEKKWTS